MKKVARLCILAILLLLIVPNLVGSFMGEEYAAVAERHFEASPTALWDAVLDPENHPVCGAQRLESVELLEERDGMPRWVEHLAGTTYTVTVVEMEEPRYLVLDIVDDGGPMDAHWEMHFSLDETGTGLRIDGLTRLPMESWTIPAFRFFFGYLGDNGGEALDLYLAQLEESQGATAAVGR